MVNSSMPFYSVAGLIELSDVLKWEVAPAVSREGAILLAGDGAERIVDIGTVVGRRTKGVPVITPDVGNTGQGAMGGLALGASALIGDYQLTCITAGAAGIFAVVAPDGRRLADATVGVAYANADLEFTIADGDPDFAVGDRITVTVPPGDGKVAEIDFTARDGGQDAAGIIARRAVAADGIDAKCVIVRRQAIVVSGRLAWPDGATADQKAAALAQLETAGVLAREEA